MTINESDSDVRQARRIVLVSYGVISVFGAVGFALSFQYEFFRYGNQVGPGFLPRAVAAIIVVLGLALMLQEIRVGSVLRGDSGVNDEAGEQSTSTRKLVVVFGLIILAVLLVPVVGLIPPLVALVAALLVYGHAIVSEDDLSRLDVAFFTVNGWVSLTLMACTLCDVLFLR